eukprot:CAMPEP_0204895158 /NCGR_PEP_ID=MMETSP1349-20130617/33856_1 /ASSEMBLY_ACC=CAM_ASM_000710 /TAXON_ID=215587 /ORGANISM="Aplanochytrium stocchinoi, Strain GSBS06" /LENGTH=306 /DNA_ID=CAMNT_0052062475 /DNA_START=170 /DNA_END=1090 /DNA_ORIENTATION=+
MGSSPEVDSALTSFAADVSNDGNLVLNITLDTGSIGSNAQWVIQTERSDLSLDIVSSTTATKGNCAGTDYEIIYNLRAADQVQLELLDSSNGTFEYNVIAATGYGGTVKLQAFTEPEATSSPMTSVPTTGSPTQVGETSSPTSPPTTTSPTVSPTTNLRAADQVQLELLDSSNGTFEYNVIAATGYGGTVKLQAFTEPEATSSPMTSVPTTGSPTQVGETSSPTSPPTTTSPTVSPTSSSPTTTSSPTTASPTTQQGSNRPPTAGESQKQQALYVSALVLLSIGYVYFLLLTFEPSTKFPSKPNAA